jgi:hypothetical protein
MAIKEYVDGESFTDEEINGSFAEAHVGIILDNIKMLQDRALTYSAGNIDCFAEAHTSAGGRMSTVDTALTTATFDTNSYEAWGLNTSKDGNDSQIRLNYDSDEQNAAVKIITSSIAVVCDKIQLQIQKVGSPSGNIVLKIRSGTITGTTIATSNAVAAAGLSTSMAYVDFVFASPILLNAATNYFLIVEAAYSVSTSNYVKIAIKSGTTGFSSYSDDGSNTWPTTYSNYSINHKVYGTQESLIKYNIPSGRFVGNVKAAIGVPMIKDWETGADIKYKIVNGSEDSDWLNCGVAPIITEFTQFTSQPTILWVKLIPKSSSPTLGYPTLYGFGVRVTN